MRMPTLLVGAAALLLVACGEEPVPTITQELQASATPAQILQALKDGNARFARGERLPRDDLRDAHQTAKGQYPVAACVDCIDSRVDPDIIFDAGLGVLFAANVAGNVVNADILGSLEYACKVAGSKVVVVVGHTNCGAIKGACDDVRFGNLTQLLAKIKPAIDAIPDDGTPRTSKNKAFTDKVATENVKRMVQKIRRDSPVLRELDEEGRILIVGGVYDVETHLVRWLEE